MIRTIIGSSLFTWIDINHNDAWPTGYVQCGTSTMVSRKDYGDRVIIGKYQSNYWGHAVDEDHATALHFSGAIQALSTSNPSVLSWVSFTDGNLPSSAVVGGQRSDGGPLYVARYFSTCGYYDPVGSHCIYVESNGAKCYTTFEILTANIPGMK